MRASKSTRGEVVRGAILTLAIMGCAFVYAEGGGRVWVFGAVVGIIALLAVVGGVAERWEVMPMSEELAGNQLVVSVLSKLVRQEYPAGLSLSEIAATWGEDVTQQELDALRVFERETGAG